MAGIEEVKAECVTAIKAGDTARLKALLDENRALAHAIADGKRSMLHVATDWPGHFPNVGETIRLLIARGADPNAQILGAPHKETPLHWAASSNDVEAIDALLDCGADIEATGASIAGGTAMEDAVAFANFAAARRLVERGARTTIWQSAALGLMERVEESFAAKPGPDAGEITNAFWNACAGGQRTMAEYLLARGADMNWVGHMGATPLDVARRNGARDVVDWLQARAARSHNTV